MNVNIVNVGKVVGGRTWVEISYPGALFTEKIWFDGPLPNEVALEVFEKLPKEQMDKIRGAE